jgi:hypothetical protein
MTMATIPTIPAPDGFEHTVLVRTALGSLPTMSAPDGFEDAVMARIKQKGPAGIVGTTRWWVVSALLAVALATVGLFVFVQPHADVVRVVPPVMTTETVDLYDLKPVAVREDVVATRWAARVSAARKAKDDVVAGR